ncbi:transcriptional regulator [Vagococcus fluvialis]|uniref:transcriptional regulator n=1 Tax=Vagococcus fluvialis TaxID=2738 RepID=UPI001A8F93DA|nr:transcriptional regulator [Vagococcus fluvialis]MBO0478737.1 transcriptional regulator [Vagococcus fluvialis]MBO0484418.1 transcriptional regulator [Vagococcus fluvialis]
MAGKLLDDNDLKGLEAEFRKYKQFQINMASIMLDRQWKEEDANFWVKSSNGNSEKALNDVIFKEGNVPYQINALKRQAVKDAFDNLSNELKHIVTKYLWGEYSYLKWPEIAEMEYVSKSTIYEWRYKILETYAYSSGKLV